MQNFSCKNEFYFRGNENPFSYHSMASHLASPWNRGLGQIGNGQLGKLYLPEMKECRLRGSLATNLMTAHFQQTLWTSLLFQGFNAISKLQLNSYMFKDTKYLTSLCIDLPPLRKNRKRGASPIFPEGKRGGVCTLASTLLSRWLDVFPFPITRHNNVSHSQSRSWLIPTTRWKRF